MLPSRRWTLPRKRYSTLGGPVGGNASRARVAAALSCARGVEPCVLPESGVAGEESGLVVSLVVSLGMPVACVVWSAGFGAASSSC